MATRLTPQAVSAIFQRCLAGDQTPPNKRVVAEGIVDRQIVFHADRLERRRTEIEALLGELPIAFRADGGGGWSFLQACMDRHGMQWTGMHRVMEQLFALGLAIGKAEYLAPREVWNELPGGMPYLVIK